MVDKVAFTRRDFLRSAGLAVASGIVAACAPGTATTTTLGGTTTTTAGGATTTPAAGTTTTAAAKLLEARYGYGNPETTVAGFTESLWPLFAARRDVNLDAFALSPNVSPETLAGGRADMVGFTPITSVNIHAAGGGAPRVIAHTQPVNDYMVVANRERVPTIEDLEGTNFGISEPTSISWVIPRLMAQSTGVDPESMNLIPVGGTSGRAQALVAGQIDAGAVYSDVAFQLEHDDPNLHIVGVGSDYLSVVFSSLNAAAPFLDDEENRDGIVRMLMARAELLQFLVNNQEEFIAQYLERFEGNAEVLAQVHEFYSNSGMWDPDLTMHLDVLEDTLRIYLEEVDPPFAQADLPLDQWVDTSFRDEAIERLGGEGWWQ